MRLTLRSLFVVVLAASAWCLAPTVAHAAKPKLAVLGIEPIDSGDPASQQKTSQLAKWLTEGLRDRAENAKARFDIAPNSRKELSEVKLLSDCLDEGQECMSAIGADLKADRLLYGQIARKKDGYAITLHLLNVQTKQFEKNRTDVVLNSDATEDGMKRSAKVWFADLSGTPLTGTIVVTTPLEGAIVAVGGLAKGTVKNGVATIEGIDEGTVSLTVNAKGHKAFEAQVDVRAGESSQVAATLEPLVIGPGGGGGPGGGDTGDEEKPGGTYRALFWTSLVATGAGAVGFTVTGLAVQDYQNQKLDAIKGTPFADKMYQDDVCGPAAAMPTAQGAQKITDVCNKGKQMATATNVLIGVTSVFAVATGVFYYKGYIAPRKAARERSASRPSTGPSVTVTPTVSPTGVGVGAVIQF